MVFRGHKGPPLATNSRGKSDLVLVADQGAPDCCSILSQAVLQTCVIIFPCSESGAIIETFGRTYSITRCHMSHPNPRYRSTASPSRQLSSVLFLRPSLSHFQVRDYTRAPHARSPNLHEGGQGFCIPRAGVHPIPAVPRLLGRQA
jgi:hypothetical protein